MTVRRVVVAGAGLAGLAAAWQLREWGHEVKVLEARERSGGRVWTVRDGFVAGQHAEAGGDLIDEGQKTILGLASRFGLEVVRILRGGFASYRIGDDGRRRVQRGGTGWAELERLLAPEIEAYRLAERQWDGPIAKALARRSVAAWLDQVRAGRTLHSMALGLRGFFLADADDLSLLQLVDELALDETGDEALYRIAGGNDRLPAALAKGVDVATGCIVRAIRQTARGVRVECEDGSGAREALVADCAVVTLPATTLRDVKFAPELPDRQREAVARLRYGAATKGNVQFDRRFWRRAGQPSAFGSDLPHGAVWDANEEQKGAQGILTLLAGGRASRELWQRVSRDGVDALREDLAWLGAAKARVVGAHVARWHDERWSRGGYAYFHPGFDPELRAWLRRPHGRVLFAGEHTSQRWQGYMNGAVESGLRAAHEVTAVSRRAGI